MIFGIIIRIGMRLLRKSGVNVPDISKIRRRPTMLDGVIDSTIDHFMGPEDPSSSHSSPSRQLPRVGARRR